MSNSPDDPDDGATQRDIYGTISGFNLAREPGSPRFTVLRLHQKGGLGRLMVALDAELNREIALKEILPAYADDEESRRRFIREAEITGALEHPGVVPVYSLGEFPDGRPYYAMRFVRGVDLLTAIGDLYAPSRDGGSWEFDFRQLLARFASVCRAIDYAHSRGVIHRDLKPANVMLGDYGETLVVDWGLARTVGEKDGDMSASAVKRDLELMPVTPSDRASSDRTQMGRVVGTLSYMSPEQAGGRLDLLGPPSDIYGLGATLFHLLTGKAPFESGADDTLLRVQQGRFEAPRALSSNVPKPLEAICLKAMARRPEDRYASAGLLALDLDRYLADEPVSAYAEPWTAQAWRWTRRHRTLVMSVAAATIVAVATLGTGVALLTAANQRERAARDEATRNFQTSVEQRERAERNLQLARNAVQKYFIQISEDTLLNQPGLQPLRDSLLRQALGYFEQFLADRGDDPSLKREAAQAQFYVGRVTETIDSAAAALPHYEQARKWQEELIEKAADASAEVEPIEVDYGATLNAIGRVKQTQGDLDAAALNYKLAADVREKLVKDKLDDVERARAYASSVMNLGLVDVARGDYDAGMKLLEQAQAARMARDAGEGAANAALVRDLGSGYFNMAGVLLKQQMSAEADAKLRAAVVAFERLGVLAPKDFENVRRLANTRRMIADAAAARGETRAAVAEYRRAAEELDRLVLRNPDVPDYAADLAGVRMNLGMALKSTGDAGALAELDGAAGILKELAAADDASPRTRRDYGAALRAAGELLHEEFRDDDARVRLEESRDVLAKLVRESANNADYAAELTKTSEALGKLSQSEAQ